MSDFLSQISGSIIVGFLLGLGITVLIYLAIVIPLIIIPVTRDFIERVIERSPGIILLTMLFCWVVAGTYISYCAYNGIDWVSSIFGR